jgi:hypothetical protein
MAKLVVERFKAHTAICLMVILGPLGNVFLARGMKQIGALGI